MVAVVAAAMAVVVAVAAVFVIRNADEDMPRHEDTAGILCSWLFPTFHR